MLSDNGNAAARQSRRRRPTSRLSIERRAILAAGVVERSKLSAQKVGDLFCVNERYISAVRRLSEADRSRLLRGEITLSDLCNGPRKPPSDEKIDRIVAKLGAERVLAAIDRLTQPSRPFAVAAE
jgi:hypothetical protein